MRNALAILLGGVTLGGCATIKFRDENGNAAHGLRFYSAKPYLLVARTGAKDAPVTVSIVHLPDLEKPQYASYRSGLGSNKLNLALANSVLTTYGYETDPKVAEAITALGALATAGGSLMKSSAEADKLRAEAEGLRLEASGEDYKAVAGTLTRVATRIRGDLKAIGDETVTAAGKQLADDLDALARGFSAPSAPARHDSLVTRFEALLAPGRWRPLEYVPLGNEARGFKDRRDQDRTDLKGELERLKGENTLKAEPTFELYEITRENGVSVLRRVIVPETNP